MKKLSLWVAVSWQRFSALCKLLEGNLKYVYLIYAFPIIVLTALVTPAFQVPDEGNHFCRAEQVSRLQLLAVFHDLGKYPYTSPDPRILVPDRGGFIVDLGIEKANNFYSYLQFDTKAKLRADSVKESKKIHWNLAKGYGQFPNTAIYPPFNYIMPAFGILIGKITGLSVIDTLYLSRCLNGLFCALICFYALGLAKTSRLLLFTILLFPTTIGLFASVSQDAIMISMACLFTAIIDFSESNDKKYSRRDLCLMMTALIVMGAGRIPYLLFGLVFFLLPLSRKQKIICFLAPSAVVITWVLLNMRNYAVVWAPPEMRINARLQIKHVISDPFNFAGLFFKLNHAAIQLNVLCFIAVLGWGNLTFPYSFYKIAELVFLLALLVSLNFHVKENWRLRSGIIIVVALTFTGIMTAQYITWMPLESPFLGGVQARYFIPLVLLLMPAGAGFVKKTSLKNWQVPIIAIVLAFPFLSEMNIIGQLIERYYLR